MDRTAALEQVLRDPTRSERDKDIARAALIVASVSTTVPYQELSVDSRAMLLALGKNHLREVSENEFAHYAQHFSHSQKQELCRQWREWVNPDDELLALIGLTRMGYWQIIRDRAKSDDVRTHALTEIRSSIRR